jgi:predicted ATPase with chaperone activity
MQNHRRRRELWRCGRHLVPNPGTLLLARFADLEGEETVRTVHVADAIRYRLPDQVR